MKYSAGDLFDKCSILRVKKEKGLNVPELEVFSKEVEEIIRDNPTLELFYFRLIESNARQFDLEDVIRVEKNLEKVGQTALLIREYNDNRVALKNKINNIVGEFEEVKLYKRG